MNTVSNRRICYVVCYKYPNYIRTRTLIAAIQRIPNIELVIVKNRNVGPLRYLELPIKLLITRLKYQPSLFIIGFRGQDVFWALYPSMIGIHKIFDEFINLHDWLVNEHHKIKEGSLPIKLLDGYIKWVMKKSDVVLEDTKAHAKLSHRIYGVPMGKLVSIPVGADEKTFHPIPVQSKSGKFEVFFFGNMLPLHGVDVILSAISKVQALPSGSDYSFTLAGGRGDAKMMRQIDRFIANSNRPESITHYSWIDYNDLPKYIANADLCLGGPFGKTGQAERVITGKTYQFIAMGKATVVGHNQAHELFRNKKNCLMVPIGDTDALADAIVWAQDNRDKLLEIGKAARRLYLDNYSVEVISNQLKKILKTV